jgi:serine/threonine protein kinase
VGVTEGAIRDAGERLRRGDPHGALSLIRAARELGASDPGLDVLEAGAALEAGRPRDAYRLLTPATGSADPRIRARATWWLGRLLAAEGDAESARQRVAEALDLDGGLASDEALRAEVDLAELDGRLGAGDAAARMLAVARALDDGGDPFGAAQVLVRVADVHLGRREPAEAERWLVAAEERAGRSDEPGLLVPVWERLAEVAVRLREPARALLLARRALARSPADDAVARARLWALVGRAHALHGDLEGAAGAHRRSAEIAERSGASGVAARLDEVAALLALGRRAEGAARLAALAPFTRHDPADAVLAALTLVAEDVAGPAYAGLVRRITRWSSSPTGRSARLLDALDRAAERSTDRIRDGAGGGRELARAVRLRGSALGLAESLGDGAEAVRQGRALQNLGGLGAPVPAGPFDLTRKLGWGAVGDVWRGRHHEHRVGVAVKVLSRRHDSPRMAQLFLTEVRAMAVLDHPNITRVLGTGTLGPEAEAASHGELRGGHPWFAMELAEGGTLETVRGRLPWSGVRAVLTSLLDALAHAHARGVVHLDLKCSNALLRRDEGRPTVVLSDFGLAKLVHTDTARGVVAGTPTTMSPEQFRGDARDLGPWTDLYALGAVAVELLTGRPVFDVGDSLDAQREAHLGTTWAGLPPEVRVPAGFEAWVHQLLAKDPAERFQRAADASHALAGLPDVPDHPVSPALEPFRPRTFTLSRHTLEEDTIPPADPGPVGAERPAAPHRPPVPADWRPLVERAPGQDFVDVAPTLFGLARVPFVGREVERDLLWRLLRAVAGGGGPRFVAICGRPGTGRTALARWLGERAHELGVATVLDATGGVDGLPGLRALVERHLRLGGLDVDEASSRAARALPGLPPWVAEDLAALVVEHGLAQPLVDRVGSVAAMIALLATGRPVVLRMARGDDDDPAERVLRQLLLDAGTPVLCVVEAADAEDDELELRLGGLDLEGSEALLDALLPLATPVRRAVARAAAGHPDLLVAIVGDLLSPRRAAARQHRVGAPAGRGRGAAGADPRRLDAPGHHRRPRGRGSGADRARRPRPPRGPARRRAGQHRV